MAVVWRYTPPKVNAAALLAAVAPEATKAAADVILERSQPLVPYEEGVLKASGRVEQVGQEAYVTYGKSDDGDEHHAPSNQYVLVQHEDADLHHPHGGQSKFLEQPFNSERDAARVAALRVVAEALHL